MFDIVYILALIWSNKAIKHQNSIIEESWGEDLEPFTENLASLLGYYLCVEFLLVKIFIFRIWLTHHLFTPL